MFFRRRTLPRPDSSPSCRGTLDQSRDGAWADVSGLTFTLENGVPANLLGGFGSAIAYASGNTFLALPDRGPNAVEFDDAIDNTARYVNRFHTVHMRLEPNPHRHRPINTRLHHYFTGSHNFDSTIL